MVHKIWGETYDVCAYHSWHEEHHLILLVLLNWVL